MVVQLFFSLSSLFVSGQFSRLHKALVMFLYEAGGMKSKSDGMKSKSEGRSKGLYIYTVQYSLASLKTRVVPKLVYADVAKHEN